MRGRFLFSPAVAMAGMIAQVNAFDVLKLVDDPEPLKCRIDGLGDTFLVARVALERNGKTITEQRSIQLSTIEFVDFEVSEAEERLMRERSPLSALRDLWESKSKWLGVPRSNAGEVALLVADGLLESGEQAKVEVAISTYMTVEERDWNEFRRARGQQGRLRSLLALGRADEALAGAKAVAETAEDPTILVETRLVMAQASRRQFEAALEEFPKWREDDEVKNEVMELFHSTIDQFLYPCLFHGSVESPAAEGLWNAAEVYVLAGEPEAADKCAEDILALYPETEFATHARQLLAPEEQKFDPSE